MAEPVNPDDINAADEDIAAEVTVSDVYVAVTTLQLTVDTLLQFLRNIVHVVLLSLCVMGASLAMMAAFS